MRIIVVRVNKLLVQYNYLFPHTLTAADITTSIQIIFTLAIQYIASQHLTNTRLKLSLNSIHLNITSATWKKKNPKERRWQSPALRYS